MGRKRKPGRPGRRQPRPRRKRKLGWPRGEPRKLTRKRRRKRSKGRRKPCSLMARIGPRTKNPRKRPRPRPLQDLRLLAPQRSLLPQPPGLSRHTPSPGELQLLHWPLLLRRTHPRQRG